MGLNREQIKKVREQERREQLIYTARRTGQAIDTEGGMLCPACAEVNIDSEYRWIKLGPFGCYNCREAE